MSKELLLEILTSDSPGRMGVIYNSSLPVYATESDGGHVVDVDMESYLVNDGDKKYTVVFREKDTQKIVAKNYERIVDCRYYILKKYAHKSHIEVLEQLNSGNNVDVRQHCHHHMFSTYVNVWNLCISVTINDCRGIILEKAQNVNVNQWIYTLMENLAYQMIDLMMDEHISSTQMIKRILMKELVQKYYDFFMGTLEEIKR